MRESAKPSDVYWLEARLPGTAEEFARFMKVLRCFSMLVSVQERQAGETNPGTLTLCCRAQGWIEILAVLLQAGCVDVRRCDARHNLD